MIHLVFFSLPFNFCSFLAISPFDKGKVYFPDFCQLTKMPPLQGKGVTNPKRGRKARFMEILI